MTDIFINYRSDDDPFAAALIDERMTQAFGPERVFRDARALHPGVDFEPELWARLRSSRVCLVLIGARWLGLTDERGNRRIDRADDFVAQEIAEALRCGLAVLPVLLNEADLPTPGQLPESVRELAGRQFARLRQRHAESDLRDLVDAVARWVTPSPVVPQQPTGKSFTASSNSGNAYSAETMTFNEQGPHR
ncbi:hypothetical protein HDA40_000180 [Hamadaea flava]|uniref:Toll/interleukin-1 receptor domain-containing protein n=1 Tax=Hamadaea flava TaxID=1742688 RepID=A0ABV8LYV1_9ACTN|nr:toll/interleukin-1 receptor domain-containing protein [Hamadaea flava]MCP2321673.1 hypothetical protein [Hamadaea flava]